VDHFLRKGGHYTYHAGNRSWLRDQCVLDGRSHFGGFTLAVFLVRKTIATHAPKLAAHSESPLAAFGSQWANLGGLAIFLYVGAEVSVMSGVIFFLEETQIMNLPSQVAGFVGPLFRLFAMFGRFIGSWLMTSRPVQSR
jgi:fucose permease